MVELVVSIPACCKVVQKKSVKPITSASRHSSRLGACGLRRNSQSANGASAAAETAKRAATKASAGMVAVAYFWATKVTPHKTAVMRSRPSAPKRLMPPPTAECRMPSGLLDFDQRAGEVLWVQKQHRLTMSADFRVSVSKHAPARSFELVAGGDDVLNLIAEVMHAAVRIAIEKLGDRRVRAQRMQEFDFRVGQFDEDDGHPMIRLRFRFGNASAECFPIGPRRLFEIGDSDSDVVELTDHNGLRFTHTSTTSTCTCGFLPQTVLTEPRTPRSMAVDTTSASRRLPGGRLSKASKMASSISASIAAPSRVRSGRPAIITSGSPAISPLAVSAIAIETTPAKLSLRRWPTHSLHTGNRTARSLARRPLVTLPNVQTSPGASRIRSPLKARKTCGTPCALAKSACSLKCNGSPCAGTAIFGRTQAYIFATSARRG